MHNADIAVDLVYHSNLELNYTIPDKIFGATWRNPVKLEEKKRLLSIFVLFNCYCPNLIS